MFVVIGGSGFIGRHLESRAADEKKWTIVVSDNSLQKGLGRCPFINLSEFAGKSGDLLLSQADGVVYLASRSDPSTFIDRPWLEVIDNVEPATRFFSRCAAINPRLKIVLLSSGGTIYGRVPYRHPIPEGETLKPISSYGLGKLMIEEALRFLCRTKGMSYNILRASNAVGSFQSRTTQGIIALILRAVREERHFQIYGDGTQVRDYIDAQDVCSAIELACGDRTFNDRVWNVGSGVGHSISEVIALIENVTNRKVKTEQRESRAFDLPFAVLDCGRIRNDLGWSRKFELIETISGMWDKLKH